MSADDIPEEFRKKDLFHHIDMGFINRRLCMTALPGPIREQFFQHQKPGDDHFAVLANDHLLVTMLLDSCDRAGVPTLLDAISQGMPKIMFRSTEQFAPCPDVYDALRVTQEVQVPLDFGKPVRAIYHTSHICSDTGRMILARGTDEGFGESIVGLLHEHPDFYEVEPLVMGAPWFDHPRNGGADDRGRLMWMGYALGEILPEDIDEFSRLKEFKATDAAEWLAAMKGIPEATVKEAFAKLLSEPTKKDWGGESNDHFSSNVHIGGQRKTAAFLLKGPANFREMTLDMCGKRADQIFRLTASPADLFVVQHAHLIGEAVRDTLRKMTIHPGALRRRYCIIDGQATYRILKAYSLLPTL